MQIDQNLSNFSDIAVQTAFVVYCVALFMSLFYYGRLQSIIEGRRAVKSQAAKVLVGAGAGDVEKQGYAGEVAKYSSGITDDELKEKERKADKLGGMTSSLMWVGIALHAAAIVLRGLATGRFPFGNLYEYVLMVSFGVLLVGNIAMQRKEWRTVWPWLLTPVLALMFYGSTKLYAESAPVVPALQSHWLPIHVTVVSLGASIGIISGIVSLLTLFRMAQPKHAEHGFFGAVARPLPSAAKIDQLAYRLAVITCRPWVWASSWALSGRSPLGAASGAGTRRKPCLSLPGSFMPLTYTRVQRRRSVRLRRGSMSWRWR